MPKGYPGTKAPHGTAARYIGHGCKCDDCRRANAEYHRRYMHANPDQAAKHRLRAREQHKRRKPAA